MEHLYDNPFSRVRERCRRGGRKLGRASRKRTRTKHRLMSIAVLTLSRVHNSRSGLFKSCMHKTKPDNIAALRKKNLKSLYP